MFFLVVVYIFSTLHLMDLEIYIGDPLHSALVLLNPEVLLLVFLLLLTRIQAVVRKKMLVKWLNAACFDGTNKV
jgi:hypothetical protein